MLSKVREYPKRMLTELTLSKGEGFEKVEQPTMAETVYNQTSYDSFVRRWSKTYDINERKPRWSELKGNFFLKLWYWIPNWILVPVSIAAGYFFNDFLKCISA